ncbi:adult cuticle protein 1-like [Toxorhynchites rutilus septentrionalis]|uniref:adult cuticle protein 1-like n=1 Tax=Toxorhynchites rutilus septentrionalis TaxID=329112 RepID=UPI002479985A|nr:adult cuticle protein 1-like [Toxorhynchites rutilus septentrionalis]
MKCMVAAVILALAVVAEAGLLPYGGWPYGLGHLGPATVVQSNILAHPYGAVSHAAIHAGYLGHPAAAIVAGPIAPLVSPVHGPVASVAHHAGVVPGATSVTANRGSVHVAPLPGHAVSQQQLNLAPAPGTI